MFPFFLQFCGKNGRSVSKFKIEKKIQKCESKLQEINFEFWGKKVRIADRNYENNFLSCGRNVTQDHETSHK